MRRLGLGDAEQALSVRDQQVVRHDTPWLVPG